MEPRRRDPGEPAPVYGDFDGQFTVEIHHKGFFSGTDNNRSYIDYEVDWFDHCDCDTWSILWIEDFVKQLGYDRETWQHDVYWCLPGKTINEGMREMKCDADSLAMIAASTVHKNLLLLVDHGETVNNLLTDDVTVDALPELPKVITPKKDGKGKEQASSTEVRSRARRLFTEATSSGYADEEMEEEGEKGAADSETDEEFYDSDYDIMDGDDDLYEEHVDKEVDDHREKVYTCDYETELAEDALDDPTIMLSKEERDKLKYNFKGFNPETDLNAPVFRLGMVFGTVEELRRAITSYSIRNRVAIKKTRNTSTTVEAECIDDCPWYLKAGMDNRKNSFVIKKYCDQHTCPKTWKLKGLTAPFLTKKFRDEFRGNEKMPLQKFEEKVQQEYNLIPSRSKLGRARRASVKQIRGEDDDQYKMLWDYGEELRQTNPGSKFYLCTKEIFDEKTKETKEHFSTLYWSLDACKRGWLMGCRPIIFVDGCHIKTRYKGNLLTAVGIDPNDCIFPIAFGIVEVESTSSWEWFLASLKDDLNICNTSPYTIMSDKQKGLIAAVAKVWPDAEHRFCVRHMYQNFHKLHKGEQLKNNMWAIARATDTPTYNKAMEKMKADSVPAYEWVEKWPPRTWIKAFFNPFPKCDILLNNMSEVFNSWILPARELPIYSMVENINSKITARIYSKQMEVAEDRKWSMRLCPKIQKKLDKYTDWAANCMVFGAGQKVFKVVSMNHSYIVDLEMETCNCKRWDLSGIPCHHAIACARNERIDPASLVHDCYSVGTYKRAYAFNVKPVRDQEHWTKMHGIAVYPPVYTKVMGRPRRNRKKDPEEKLMKEGGKKLTKHGVTMHCSLCGSADHNKKGHKKWEETTRDAPQPANVADDEEEEYDDPTIISNILPHTVHPHMDPSQTPGSMVFLMQQMERRAYQPSMDHGPLPESTFVAQARNDIPPPRVTTAMSRGRVRRRGVTEDIPEDVPQSSNQAGISRGRKRRSTGAGGAAAGRGGRGSREATGRGGRGFGASGASSREIGRASCRERVFLVV